MKKKNLIAALLCASAVHAHAAVLTFDDIAGATQNNYGAIGTYAGYLFGANGDANRMDWIDTVTSNEFFNRGAVSGDFTMLNNFGGAAIIKRIDGSQFSFGGLWAETWLDWDTTEGSVQGYRAGQLVWSQDTALDGIFRHVSGVAGNIDELRLDLGSLYLVDNLELNDPAQVPTPAAPALLAIGLAGLALVRRRSSSASRPARTF